MFTRAQTRSERGTRHARENPARRTFQAAELVTSGRPLQMVQLIVKFRSRPTI